MEKLIVTTSPHFKHPTTTTHIMGDVLIALSPAAVMAVVWHGWYALAMIAICVGCAVLSEFLFNIITKRAQSIGDLSAAVTGLLLALSLPSTVTPWQCIVGAVFAIVVVKCLFGGIGCNFANPAITARVLMIVAFTDTVAGGALFGTTENLVGGATPLEALGKGAFVSELPTLFEMLIGMRGGAIGEGCALALIVGGIYLVAKRVINWRVPVILVGTVFVLAILLTGGSVVEATYHVLGGGLLIVAIFMATDYSTTPINLRGKMVFALGAGLITVLIRFYGSYPEGVSFAILLMNILSPYIERWTAKKPFGGAKNEK